ncbi:unnamed protein product [Closterium sp. NIES-54]
MHEAERVDRYVGGLKPEILHEIMLRGRSNFNEIIALAEKIDILRRPRPGVLSEVDGAGIVTPGGGAGLRGAKLSKKKAELAGFLGSHGANVELSLAGGEGNGGGACGAPANKATAEGEAVALRGAAVGLRVGLGGVTKARKEGRGGATKSEGVVLGAAKVAEDPLSSFLVHLGVATSANKASEHADGVGEVGTGAHHSVHQRPNELSIRVRGGGGRGGWGKLVAKREGGGHGTGLSHLELLQDLADVMRLGEGDGVSGTVASDSHAKVVGEVAQVLALEALLQLLLHLLHVSLGVSEQDHVIHIHQNEEAARGGAKEETGVRMRGRDAKGPQGGRQLRVPLPRCLLQAVDRPTQLPHSVLWKGGVEPGGSPEEDTLVQVPLQERVGDVHGADLHVVACTNVEEGAEGGRLGRSECACEGGGEGRSGKLLGAEPAAAAAPAAESAAAAAPAAVPAAAAAAAAAPAAEPAAAAAAATAEDPAAAAAAATGPAVAEKGGSERRREKGEGVQQSGPGRRVRRGHRRQQRRTEGVERQRGGGEEGGQCQSRRGGEREEERSSKGWNCRRRRQCCGWWEGGGTGSLGSHDCARSRRTQGHGGRACRRHGSDRPVR